MLKRARLWLVIALIAGVLGFGILRNTAVLAQSLFYICLGFCVLSVLFSLFEEEGGDSNQAMESAVQPSAVPLQALVVGVEANTVPLEFVPQPAWQPNSPERSTPPTALAA